MVDYNWIPTKKSNQVAQMEAGAFAQVLSRQSPQVIADVERLREEVFRVAARQYGGGVLLAADYVDTLTDLVEARLTAEQHRIERARAQATLLSLVGLFLEVAPFSSPTLD